MLATGTARRRGTTTWLHALSQNAPITTKSLVAKLTQIARTKPKKEEEAKKRERTKPAKLCSDGASLSHVTCLNSFISYGVSVCYSYGFGYSHCTTWSSACVNIHSARGVSGVGPEFRLLT